MEVTPGMLGMLVVGNLLVAVVDIVGDGTQILGCIVDDLNIMAIKDIIIYIEFVYLKLILVNIPTTCY